MNRRVSRSPLLSSLRELDILADEDKRITRREFIKKTAGAAGILAASPILSRLSFAKDAPKVAIIGGGIAGLNAAYTLRKAGILAQVYEGSSRLGGRIMTGKNILAEGITTEFGGEFIDSSHSEMIALSKEFGLELLDRKTNNPLIERAYYFGGRLRTEKEVISEFRTYVSKIQEDAASLPKYFDYQSPGTAGHFDSMSLADYFSELTLSGWLRDLLDTAYITEFGAETSEQSALNFLTMIGTDLNSGFEIFGSSDERFVIAGGNIRIIEELAGRLAGQILTSQKLESIRPKGTGFTLTFDGSNSEIDADIVLLTLPFSMLREVDLKIDLPSWKRKAIDELGYGHHTKVMAGFSQAFWKKAGYTGEIFSDQDFQLCWDNSQGKGKGLTSFTGGKKSAKASIASARTQANKFAFELGQIFPGAGRTASGKYFRFNWTTYSFTKGSYSFYKPGQWTSIHGAEGKPIGNLFFAGEHTSLDFQGFMNGGAESGKQAAASIIGLVK